MHTTVARLLFAPRCWSCARPLKRNRDFCFSCRRQLYSSLLEEGALLRYEGAVKGLLACLRSEAPLLGAEWCFSFLERAGWTERWQKDEFSLLALAPQNPRREERGLFLLGKMLAARLKIPLSEPFVKVNLHRQHGRSLEERMDTACFVRLKSPVSGRVLLLDDVVTTGTTLDQCAYLLRKGGAEEVSAFSLARQMEPKKALAR